MMCMILLPMDNVLNTVIFSCYDRSSSWRLTRAIVLYNLTYFYMDIDGKGCVMWSMVSKIERFFSDCCMFSGHIISRTCPRSTQVKIRRPKRPFPLLWACKDCRQMLVFTSINIQIFNNCVTVSALEKYVVTCYTHTEVYALASSLWKQARWI